MDAVTEFSPKNCFSNLTVKFVGLEGNEAKKYSILSDVVMDTLFSIILGGNFNCLE
jgi:hypothetical protein